MKLAIVGTGYVGLVTGACLAEMGHNVLCIDSNPDRISALEAGQVPFFEPGLPELVARNYAAGRLGFSGTLDAASEAIAIFIAVGTPPRKDDGHADLEAVYSVAREIGSRISKFTLVITKSTVPVGTGDEIEAILATSTPAENFAVISNPEFLREGSAIADFMHPDRIVAGTGDERAILLMQELYHPLTSRGVPLMVASRRSAELSKYAANSFLAMKVAFINEIADLCEKVDADVASVAEIIGSDERIGARFLRAGPGFGGSCFPKDTLSLIHTARAFESPVQLIETTISGNLARHDRMIAKIERAAGGSLHARRITVWGLTFKPGTDDMRESPAIPIIAGLAARGAIIVACDPEGIANARALDVQAQLVEDPLEAAAGADILVLMTEWEIFTRLGTENLAMLYKAMGREQPVIVDLRNALSREAVTEAGFRYWGVGIADPATRPGASGTASS